MSKKAKIIKLNLSFDKAIDKLVDTKVTAPKKNKEIKKKLDSKT